jgi:plastocyanin
MTTLQNIQAGWRRVLLLGLAAAAALVSMGLLGTEAGAAGADDKTTVKIVGFAFKPGTVKIDRGTTVVFANTTKEAHTATAKSFDTKRIGGGTSKAIRFNQAGTFAYHCKIHPFMKGKVVVH